MILREWDVGITPWWYGGVHRSQAYDAPAYSARHRLCAVTCAKLLHDVFYVDFYGLFAYEEFLGNVAVTIFFGDASKDIDFALGQGVVTIMLGQASCDFRQDELFAGMDPADYFHQILGRHAFQYVGAGSGFEGVGFGDVSSAGCAKMLK